MDEQRLDFLGALGEEFCTVVRPLAGPEISRQDGYEIFAKVLGDDFGPNALALLNESQIQVLCEFGRAWLDLPSLTDIHIQEVVRRTLTRW